MSWARELGNVGRELFGPSEEAALPPEPLPNELLLATSGGANQIKRHEFFLPLFDPRADVVGQFNALAEKSQLQSLSVPRLNSSEKDWVQLESMHGVLSDSMPSDEQKSFFVGF